MNKFFGIISLLSLLVLGACYIGTPYGGALIPPVDDGTFVLRFASNFENEAFVPGNVYQSPDGRDYQWTRYRFLLSDVRLVGADGTEDTLATDVLVNPFDGTLRTPEVLNNTDLSFQTSLPPGEYVGLRFGLGVPDPRNTGNPAVFPGDHPLSINRGMHWGWSTGYKFLQIEGKFDSTLQSQDLSQNFVYHTGHSEFYRVVSFETDFEVQSNQTTTFNVELDIAETIYNSLTALDLETENFSHAALTDPEQSSIAEKLTENFASGVVQLGAVTIQ